MNFHENPTITPLPLRPPEVFLGAEWDKPADIRTFGCLARARHLITRGWERSDVDFIGIQTGYPKAPLPLPAKQKNRFGRDGEHTLSMVLYTKEDLRAEQLQVSPKAPEYFSTNCKNPPLSGILVNAHLLISSGQLRKNPMSSTALPRYALTN